MDRSDQNPGADSRDDLQPNREQAIPLMVAGLSNPEIADKLGVHRATVYRWRNDPAIAKEVDAGAQALRAALRLRLAEKATLAIDTLGDLCGENQPPEVRHAAAVELLNRVVPTEQTPSMSVYQTMVRTGSVEEAKAFMKDVRGKEVQSG